MYRVASLALCALLLVPFVRAQSAEDVLRDALAQYEADMAEVDNYTLSQTAMGFPATIYAERTAGGAPLDYTYYVVLPTGLEATEGMGGGSMSNPYLMLDRIREDARYAGREDVEGTDTHVIVVDDFQEIAREFNALPEEADGELEVETLTLYLGADDHRIRKMQMEGTMEQDGRTSPVVMDAHFRDYRTVDGLTIPFRTTMEMQGMEGQMDAGEREEARRQLEEARAQMASMPAAQRQMMERMMGDRLEQLEQMLEGDGLSFEVEVTDVKVNAGRPN
jgi:hypothetical protein